MIGRIVSLALVLLLACGEESVPRAEPEVQPDAASAEAERELWVCWHPGTQFHDKECVVGFYPDGCFVEGDNSRFCWTVTPEDCVKENSDRAWYKHCHLL